MFQSEEKENKNTMETFTNTTETNEDELNVTDTSDQQSQEKTITSKNSSQTKKKKHSTSIIDERAEEVYAYLTAKRKKEEISGKKLKDECEIFGELVVSKLKSFDIHI